MAKANEAVVDEPNELVTTHASRLALKLGVVDPRRGVMAITAGPAYDLASGNTTSHVRRATHLCGDEAVRAAREGMQALFDSEESRCDDRRCTKPPRGEWDSQTDIRFVRAEDGTLLVDSVVVVLDVPMRPSAEKDFAWAEQRRAELAVTPSVCAGGPANRP